MKAAILLAGILLGGSSLLVNGQAPDRKAPSLQLSLGGSGTYTRDHIPIEVTFKATGEPIRLLNEFGNVPIPVFFDFQVVQSNGISILIPAVVIEWGPTPLKYVEVAKGRDFKVTVRIDALLPNIAAGEYDISATYRNNHGENCFKGETGRSAPIRIRIVLDQPANR